MEELLQNINSAHLPLIGAAVALLCIAALVIGFLLQAISGVFELIFGFFGLVIDLLQGGPVAWLGCALLVVALCVCAGIVLLALNAPDSCAQNPTRFCQWLGLLPG